MKRIRIIYANGDISDLSIGSKKRFDSLMRGRFGGDVARIYLISDCSKKTLCPFALLSLLDTDGEGTFACCDCAKNKAVKIV